MKMTTHCSLRMQQRGIPNLVLDALLDCGSPKRTIGGERLVFDKAARRRLERLPGGNLLLKHLERWLRVYVVLSDCGSIVTVAHGYRRIRNV